MVIRRTPALLSLVVALWGCSPSERRGDGRDGGVDAAVALDARVASDEVGDDETDASERPEPTPIELDLGIELPEIGTTFSRSQAFSAALGPGTHLVPESVGPGNNLARETLAISHDFDGDGDIDVMVSAEIPGPWATHAMVWNEGGDRWRLERFVPEVSVPPWGEHGYCRTIIDVVGDAANDLVCDTPRPGLTIVEGRLVDGREVYFEDGSAHVVEPANLDGEIVRRGSTRFPEFSSPDQRHAEVGPAFVFDFDRDGDRDLLVPTLGPGTSDPFYLQEPRGEWTRRLDQHFGYTFAGCPIRVGDRLCMSFMTEGGRYEPGWNDNDLSCYDIDTRAFAPRYGAPRPAADPRGYLGPPLRASQLGTPMGCAHVQIHPGRAPVLVFSQETPTFPTYAAVDGTFELLVTDIPGFRVEEPAGSEGGDDHWREMWGLAATSLRGTRGVQDLVSASIELVVQVNTDGNWFDPLPGYGAVQVRVRERARYTDIGGGTFATGGYKALDIDDFDRDGRPDLLLSGPGRMPEVWYNRLEPAGAVLHVEARGCDRGCRLEVEHEDLLHDQMLPNVSNPFVQGRPHAFVGLGVIPDGAEIRVRIDRDTRYPVQEAVLAWNEEDTTWYFDPGVPPYQRADLPGGAGD